MGSIYVQDDGGFGATDEQNYPVPEIYFMGIIDILQPYNVVKRMEHHWKAFRYDPVRTRAAVLTKQQFLIDKLLIALSCLLALLSCRHFTGG